MGRPSMAERKPYTVESLTDVAFGLFRTRGYDATSLDQIAQAAGITKSSIYYHVSGKEELLARGVQDAMDRLFAVLDEAGANQGPYAERIRFVLHRSVEVELGALDRVSVLLRLRGNTQTERCVLERRREFDRRVAALIGEAMAHGEIRSDLAPALVTRLLFSMANWLTEWYDPRGALTVTDIADAIITLAFEGLEARPRTPTSKKAGAYRIPLNARTATVGNHHSTGR